MGTVELPSSGLVYVDTQVCVYSVENHAAYASLLRPLWVAAQAGQIQVATSALALMESIVLPLRHGQAQVVADFERFFQLPAVWVREISLPVLREAARLRAVHTSLRTPDAIHAATAILAGAAMFLTNDKGFRKLTLMNVLILDDARYSP